MDDLLNNCRVNQKKSHWEQWDLKPKHEKLTYLII